MKKIFWKNMWHAVFTASPHNNFVMLLLFNMTLAISWITLFFLSTTPFCWGVLGAENSCLVPWSLQKDPSLEFSNSLPWSILMRATIAFFSIWSFLHRCIIFSGVSDLSLKRITQVYRVKHLPQLVCTSFLWDFELWLDPLDQCVVTLMV